MNPLMNTKTIIRIVQDYCFNNSAPLLSGEFALYVATALSPAIEQKELTIRRFTTVVSERQDFFLGNNLNVKQFCKGLFEKLNYELSFMGDVSFYAAIKEYKRKMENGVCKGFPKDKTSEDALRGTLSLYIKQETFCEARASTGNNDIAIPSEKVVIETKLWNGLEYYNSGIPELHSYLSSYNYSEGYYVIFDYTRRPNEVIKQNGEIFDIMYSGKKIHVFFIRMNTTAPSQIYKEAKKNSLQKK